MILRSAAMATAVTLGGAAFIAGAATGAGLSLAAVGAACLARRALKHRRDWGRDHDHGGKDDRDEIAASLASEGGAHPGVASPG